MTTLTFAGTTYRLDGDRLCKRGASAQAAPAGGTPAKKKRSYKESTTYTDDKGRNWVFNESTRRWKIDRGEGGGGKPAATPEPAPQPKPVATAPAPQPKPKSRVQAAMGNLQSKVKQVQESAKGKLVHAKHALIHEGDVLGENIVSWKTGKIVGGAIAEFAVAHGAPPIATHIIAESVVQAGTATAINALKQRNSTGKIDPKASAAYFVKQVAAGYLGKYAHHGTEWAFDNVGVSEMAQHVGPLLAGKITGISTVVGMGRYHLDSRVVDAVMAKANHDINLMNRFINKLTNGQLMPAAPVPIRKAADEDERMQALIWDLIQAGIVLALHQKSQPNPA